MASKETSSTVTEDSSVPELYDSSKVVGPAKGMKSKGGKQPHPSTAEMVMEAIANLADRNGLSLMAIKKYIANTWNLNVDKHATYIKKYLKSAVANGSLIQIKGRGASGSFKIPPGGQKSTAAKEATKELGPTTKPVASKKTESPKVDATRTKKRGSSKKKVSSTSLKNIKKIIPPVTEPKSPSKTKKVIKSPTSKPKAPKPKKGTATRSLKVVSPKALTSTKK